MTPAFARHTQFEPNLDDIEEMANIAFAQLPEVFRVACGRVVFRVAEYAD